MSLPKYAMISVLSITACLTTGDGTYVGNPSLTTASIAPGGQNLTITESDIILESITLTGEEERTFSVDAPLDLVASDTFEVPGGFWTSITFTFSSPLSVVCSKDDGGEVSAQLDLPSLTFTLGEGFESDGAPFLLQLASDGWMWVDGISYAEEAEQVLTPEDEAYGELLEGLKTQSALYRDLNGDGVIDDGDELVANPSP